MNSIWRYAAMSLVLLGLWWGAAAERSRSRSAKERQAVAEDERAIGAWKSGDRSRVEAILQRTSCRGMNILAALDDEPSELRLVELLLGSDTDLAFMAASPLAMRRSARAMSALLSALTGARTAVPVRYQTAMAIVESGTDSAFQQLLRLFLQSDGDVAYACAWAIHRVKRTTPSEVKLAACQLLRRAWERQLVELDQREEDKAVIRRRLRDLSRDCRDDSAVKLGDRRGEAAVSLPTTGVHE